MPEDAVVIIPAAGQGKRMAADRNKVLLSLGTDTILQHTLHVFRQHSRIAHIYLVIASRDREALDPLFAEDEKITMVSGGAERQDSVFNALHLIQQRLPAPRWVLIHDGARPLCPPSLVDRILEQCAKTGAAIPVMPMTDTIRQITPEMTKVLDRSQLFATQTPQGFETPLLIEAYQAAQEHGWTTTDDASVVEQFGHAVSPVEGAANNFKITTPHDLEMAEWVLTRNHNKTHHGSID